MCINNPGEDLRRLVDVQVMMSPQQGWELPKAVGMAAELTAPKFGCHQHLSKAAQSEPHPPAAYRSDSGQNLHFHTDHCVIVRKKIILKSANQHGDITISLLGRIKRWRQRWQRVEKRTHEMKC